ncbi:MAG: hypothetical protein HFH92_18370 [Lachnospiraceae bacterium]|nr:hypothetical protein [Lachnospiraceae bacterium]
MLEQIFLKVLDMSRTASMIIVIVSLARILLKRFPKSISYVLWSVVLFRLLCPFTLEFRISLVPSLKPVFYEYTSEKESAPTGWAGEPAVADTGAGVGADTGASAEADAEDWPEMPKAGRAASGESWPDGNTSAAGASWQELFLLYGKYVWISGAGILFLCCMVSAARVRGKVSVSIPLKENIYVMDEMMSPFVMGILKPRIYLPGCLEAREQEYIIQHERFHIRRLDHIAKPLASAALCIHWFNPLVWIAFALFCRDMEMSCDEAVIKKLGEGIRADYSASLLALSARRRILRWSPVDFGQGDTKGRIRNLASFRKTNRGVLAILAAGAAILIVCLASNREALVSDTANPEAGTDVAEGQEMLDGAEPNGLLISNEAEPEESNGQADPEPLVVSLDIREQYITHNGSPNNLFYIDEDGVLWGSGYNEYGQLGQGTQDYEFHSEMVRIAENAVHVDYSQDGFVIFLTEDRKLYGMGNAGCGALQQYEEFDSEKYVNGEHYTVTTPILLIEDVVYACCGRDDIVCLKEDGTVWTWGTIIAEGGSSVYFLQKPEKILEDAVLVTGGWFNHAALLRDGTVWTWGYNSSGNCGVAKPELIGRPTIAAEGVVMVWTNFALENLEPDREDLVLTWTGSLRYNMEYDDIAEFVGIGPRILNNTVIQKADGSYWVCGENVGTEEKMVHGMEGVYPAVCTHEFHPCK